MLKQKNFEKKINQKIKRFEKIIKYLNLLYISKIICSKIINCYQNNFIANNFEIKKNQKLIIKK